MKKLIFFLILIIFYTKINAQNENTKEKTKLIGVSTSLLLNHSFIDYGINHEKIKDYGHKIGLGYSSGFSYMVGKKKWFFEFDFNYAYENIKFTNVPVSTLTGTILPDSVFHVYSFLDYSNTRSLNVKYSYLNMMFKLYYYPIVTRHLSFGLGMGFSPGFILMEKGSEGSSGNYEDIYLMGNKHAIILRPILSTSLLYKATNRLFLKAAISSTISISRRDYSGFNTRIFNTGVEVGIYYKLKS